MRLLTFTKTTERINGGRPYSVTAEFELFPDGCLVIECSNNRGESVPVGLAPDEVEALVQWVTVRRGECETESEKT